MSANDNDYSYYLKKAEYNYKNRYEFKQRVDYANIRKKTSVDPHTIMYTSFYGRGMCCNPYAVFLYLLGKEEYKDYKHIWVLDVLDDHPVEKKLYSKYSNVSFVEFGSTEYMEALSTSKYIFDNSTGPRYFIKKPEQVMINTWHGIPLKMMGFDIPGYAGDIGNTLRNFFMHDYILSADSFMTQEMYTKAYKLKNIYEGKIVEAGYPRFDTIGNTDRDEFIDRLAMYGVDVSKDKKIVLYAPTWKGNDFGNPNIDVDSNLEFIDELYKYVDPDKYQILFKPHQAVYNAMKKNGVLNPNCVPGNIDANELLSVTDILIGDYSSIFFDYLVTGRPILFYIPDLENYMEERGLYFSVNELPGPVSEKVSDIGEWLGKLANDIDSYKDMFEYEKYQRAVDKFIAPYDGKSCEKVVDAIFNGNEEYAISLKTDKPKILIHVDVLKPNGITTSVLNLLNNIDYDKYDVTLNTIAAPGDKTIYFKINENVRALARKGTVVVTLEESAKVEYCKEYNIIEADNDPMFPKEVFELEYKRCYGDVHFDYIINFSGYSGFFSNIFSVEKNAKHLMWMHNDLKAELEERIVDGEQIFAHSLPQVFKHYHNVDKIVGCSQSTMMVNREKLGEPDTMDKFAYMHNVMDIDRIKTRIDDEEIMEIDGHKYFVTTPVINVHGCNNNKFIHVPDDNTINFVTVARLSVEKNQEALIKAFSKLYEENTNIRLYIMGDGPLRKTLGALITKLKLQGKVFLLGNIDNPFSVMKRCHCFILPSHHEGMPMVLLEARTLKMPIIVSDFSTVKDSLLDNGQLLIKTGVDDIYEGLKAFVAGEVPSDYKFDPIEYNSNCMKEFEQLLN